MFVKTRVNCIIKNIKLYTAINCNKYYIAYLNGRLRPLHIIIKNIKLYTNHVNVLDNDNELLKYIEIWSNIEALFNGVALSEKGVS